ncbi:MAG: bifunctional YncE family protein/alkaline phosphatase family protein [Acidiferrobacter sp.]
MRNKRGIEHLAYITLGILMSGGMSVASAHVVPNVLNVTQAVTLSAANRADYTHILPTGRVTSPVGRINGTPNFATAVLALGHTVLVLANGATHTQTITLYNAHDLARSGQIAGYPAQHKGPQKTHRTVLTVGHQNFFQGLAAGPHNTFYAAGGDTNDIAAFRLVAGKPVLMRRYALTWQAFPKNQYPYHYQGHHIGAPRLFYPDAIAQGPRGRHVFVTGLLANSLARINLATGRVRYLNVGAYPFALTLADKGRRLAISLWGSNAVAVVDPRRFTLLGLVPVGPTATANDAGAGVHPTAILAVPNSPYAFVTLSNIDRIAEINTETLKPVRLLDDSPYPHAPPGSYPDGLALAQGHLFVANAGNNDVAVFSLRSGRPQGLIPTGWYPTALTASPKALYIVAAKGLGSGPNVHHQWVGNMMDGLIQKIRLSTLSQALARWTPQALRHNGFSPSEQRTRIRQDHAVTSFVRRHIQYVVFILRENKTFDEDLGDYKRAGRYADPHLDLYGPRELPNLYHLAQSSTLFVQFLADGEVTAQGHQWTTGASDSDFVQRTWAQYYSGRGLVANPGWTQSLTPGGATGTGGIPLGADNPYAIYENLSVLGKWSNPWISYPGRLFLFNDLLNHNVSFEDFGEFVSRARAGTISKAMQAHLATNFPGWDRMMLDTTRTQLAIRWLKAHPGKTFPHFVYIWLPDDHTAGRQACYYSPDYYVANNDVATAQLIHYLSTTPEWRHMVVFLTEDDAQSGADHINAHRTFALALGPWVKKGLLDAHPYSQVNILKTTEAILGLPPLSQWDQTARVFSGIWTHRPNFAQTPVYPSRVPVTFNAGVCTHYTLLRREAGATDHILSPQWYKAHIDKHGRHAARAQQTYAPTTLLKVPGPVQMRQEWIATKGSAAYRAQMHYLAHYARVHGAPLAAYVGGAGD